MLASLTPNGKRKFPFENQNYERSGQVPDLQSRIMDDKSLMAPDSKRPCHTDGTTEKYIPVAAHVCIDKEEMLNNLEMESAEVTIPRDGESMEAQISSFKQYECHGNLNNNCIMDVVQPSHNLCTRCQAGESGHIRHIFH